MTYHITLKEFKTKIPSGPGSPAIKITKRIELSDQFGNEVIVKRMDVIIQPVDEPNASEIDWSALQKSFARELNEFLTSDKASWA